MKYFLGILSSWIVAAAVAFAVWAAPADDGQTAGSRSWILFQGRLGVSVTPDDNFDLATAPTRFIYVSKAASSQCGLAVRFADGGTTAVTLPLMQVGVFHPIQVKRVMSTNTDCTTVIAVY